MRTIGCQRMLQILLQLLQGFLFYSLPKRRRVVPPLFALHQKGVGSHFGVDQNRYYTTFGIPCAGGAFFWVDAPV